MKHIAGWFRRNNTIMAQAKDLGRQLQEAWDSAEDWKSLYEENEKDCDYLFSLQAERGAYLRDQLHRVARERDQERKKRLAAEDALLDMYLDKDDYGNPYTENEEE